MRDAMGGTVTMAIIVIFIAIALGYMAFNVNYTKAFRMKDKIITLFDDYDGKCMENAECKKEIDSYARYLGYKAASGLTCPNDDEYRNYKDIFCYRRLETNSSNSVEDKDLKKYNPSKHYYKIVTKVNIEVPIINNVLNFKFFYVFGNTKSYGG